MFFGISHLIVPTADLERAAQLWRDVIGAEVHRGDGFVDIDTGSATLRLAQVSRVESSLSLRLQVRQVQTTYDSLLAAGCSTRYAPMKTPELEGNGLRQRWRQASIVLWRPLSEDEWGFVPEHL